MSNATLLLARRSIRARIGRLIAIAIAIVLGVAFVVGSFVLAATLRSYFDTLFTEINAHTDLAVRTELAFESSSDFQTRDPLPADLVGAIEDTPGVTSVDPVVQRRAVIIDEDGDALSTQGAPMFGISWDGDTSDSAIRVLEGEAPGAGETVIDKASADNADIDVGDRVQLSTDTGTHPLTVSGLIGIGNTDGFGGATVALMDDATAAEILGAEGEYDVIELAVADDYEVADVQAALEEAMPAGVEVVTQDALNDEANDSVNEFIAPVQTGLLAFAFITAFVSAFLINNVFAITIGQRLRELALLRAVGGRGRQVRRLIVSEALLMSIVATVIGIGGGLGVARLLLAIFDAAGAGFPSMSLVLEPLAVVMAFVVGVGITLAAVTIPARRAAKIPPVAAMRPELGFESLSSKRLIAGTVTMVLGVVLFLVGLFARPGGTPGLVATAGGGALLLFLGTGSVASTVARPTTRMLGWPVGKVYKAPGQLARDNAGRAPRRTSATASALMIGVALVSAASVFAASLRETFKAAMERGVAADYVVAPTSFTGMTRDVANRLAELPELSAVSGVSLVFGQVAVDGENDGTKALAVADATAMPELMNLGMVDGDEADLADGVLVHTDPAGDHDLEVGDVISVTFQNGAARDIPVAGIYEDSALAGNWVVSQQFVDEALDAELVDFLVAVQVADGVADADATAAIDRVLEDYPQAELKTADEYTDDSAAQIDSLLVIISVLLGFAIVIAVLGISITLGLAVYERTREIGLLRAVGMTKRQTRKMVRWESVIVSAFGAVLGIVLGTLIGVALALAVPDNVIDRVVINPSTIVAILVGAVVAGLIAALYPSRKASNMDILQAITTE